MINYATQWNGGGPFWMVYGMSQGAPHFKHPSLEDAKREAERLAAENPGVLFCVLEVVGACIAEMPKPPVRDVPLDKLSDQIPF